MDDKLNCDSIKKYKAASKLLKTSRRNLRAGFGLIAAMVESDDSMHLFSRLFSL